EMGDRANPGATVDDAVPARGQVIAERRQDADSGDGDAALGHGQLSLSLRCIRGQRAVSMARCKTHEAAMRPRVCYRSTGRVDGFAWRDDARPTGQARPPDITP